MAALAALLASTSARAEPSCDVRVRSDAREWRAAAQRVEEIVRNASTGDCREIVVEPNERGATVRLTTRDERVAIRRIAKPAELFALVEALLVTVDAPAQPEQPEQVEPVREEPPPVEPATEAPPERDVAPAPKPSPNGARVAVTAGAVAGDGEIGTIGIAQVGLVHEAWELSIAGSLEPEHDGTHAGARVRTSAFGASGIVARRFDLGPTLLFVGGGLGLYSATEEEEHRSSRMSPEVADTILEPRAGLTMGAVSPAIGRIRFRAQLDGQVGIFAHTPAAPELPTFPHFALALTLGAETTFLP